jgi:hypothetical protein
MFCPFGLGPELSALMKDGYRVVGQRWTAPARRLKMDGRDALCARILSSAR